MTRRACRALGTFGGVALILGSAFGCSIRQDASGLTRVGIGLWGFGDPPGVHWNLDWPRRDVRELPAGARNELPARRVDPASRGPERGLPDAAPSRRVPLGDEARR